MSSLFSAGSNSDHFQAPGLLHNIHIYIYSTLFTVNKKKSILSVNHYEYQTEDIFSIQGSLWDDHCSVLKSCLG